LKASRARIIIFPLPEISSETFGPENGNIWTTTYSALKSCKIKNAIAHAALRCFIQI